MKKDRKRSPSLVELRLKAELEQARRELNKLKKLDSGDRGAVAGGGRAGNGSPSAEAGRLRQRIDELERTRERLSKLYFGQLDENRRRAGKLHDILRSIGEVNADLDLDSLLQRIAVTIQGSLGFRIVFIRLREPGTDRLRAAAFAGLGPAPRAALQAEDVRLEQFLSWLRDDSKVSRSYLISHREAFSRTLPPGYVPDLGRREEWEWHPEDVLFVPLWDAGGELIGYFSVDDPADRLVPSQETIELLEVFAGHAVVAIENARLYRQLAQRTRELEEADLRMKEMNRLRGQFVSTISHELRTPLTAIQAYADTLLATGIEDVPPERLRHFVEVINEEGQRLARLVESVLDLSRFDSGHGQPHRNHLDLGEVVEEAAWLLQRMAETRQVDLKLERELADTHVDVDRDQMRQLVLHLGSNAIKFTPAGGRVALRLLGDERCLVLQVEDTGIGIPEEALEKIFDRFYQVDSSLVRRYGGSGLGLSICKSIVEWHGGEIRAHSTPDQGSCFTVTLPRHMGPRVVLRPGTGLSAATKDVLRLAIEMVSEVMNASVVSLMSQEPGESLVIQAAIGLDDAVVTDTRVPVGAGVAGGVAHQRRPVCVARCEETEAHRSGRGRYRTGTFISIPLEGRDGLLGVLNVTDPVSGQPFQAEDCNLVLELGEAISRVWQEALGVEARQVQIAGTADALRRVLEHVRLGRRSAPHRVQLAQETAKEMCLPVSEITFIALAATVHDVGMTLVDREILEGGESLTAEARDRMQRHVELGAEVLGRLETLSTVRDIVMSHHEWWDGTGYPRGLQGVEIPVGARVLAVVDAFESMTQGRAHHPPQPHDVAVAEIQRLRGKQFDPDVVDAFVRILPASQPAEAAEGRVPATP